jgi:hypothetical protein
MKTTYEENRCYIIERILFKMYYELNETIVNVRHQYNKIEISVFFMTQE